MQTPRLCIGVVSPTKASRSTVATCGGSQPKEATGHPQGGIPFMRPFPESPKFPWTNWELSASVTRTINSYGSTALSWSHLRQHWISYKRITVVMAPYHQPSESWCQGHLSWKTPSQGWQLTFQMSLWRYAYIPKPLIFLQIDLGRFVALHHS